MSNLNKEAYKSAIKELDSDGDIVDINRISEVSSISSIYSDEIEIGRDYPIEDEEFCRAYIVAWLCTEGGYSPSTLHLEKEYTIGRPGGTSAWGDILVRRQEDDSFNPYLLIEVKTPTEYDEEDMETIEGQLYDLGTQEAGLSTLSLATVTETAGNFSIRCITVDYARYPTMETWEEDGRPKASSLPKHYAKPVPEPLVKDGERDLREAVSLDELDTIWSHLHDLLWGGHLDDNVVFEWVVRLLLSKIYDEKATKSGEEYDFQIKYQGGAREGVTTTFNRINKNYKEAVARYLQPNTDLENIEGISDQTFDPYRVRNVVKQLQDISFTKNNQFGDILSRFFGKIVRGGFKQSEALYLTPPNLVYFMLNAVDISSLAVEKIKSSAPLEQRMPYVIDPACGSGTFLLATFRLIVKHIEENKEEIAETEDIKQMIESLFGPGQSWAHTHLYGLDPHRSLPIAAKVNMILHGDGSGHIFQKGALLPFESYTDIDDQRRLEPSPAKSDTCYDFPTSESFDVVVSNPPFSITLSDEEKNQLKNTFKFSREEKSENLFFERWYQLLKPDGRLGVVLPESFFSVGKNSYIRRFAFKHFDIKAVVSLPDVAFQPHTTTLTSLLFARKKRQEEINEWNEVWEEEKQELRDEVDNLRSELYKKNWPSQGNTIEWIKEKVENCEKFLEPYEVQELQEKDDVEEVVEKLRYRLSRAKGEGEEEIILREVLKKLDYKIPIISVENIGYKQTKRSTRLKPNELFTAKDTEGNQIKNMESVDKDFYLDIDTSNPSSALDIIRGEIDWE